MKSFMPAAQAFSLLKKSTCSRCAFTRHQKASFILVIAIFTLVISLILQESMTAIWYQKRLSAMEQQQVVIARAKRDILNQIISYLDYKLDKIDQAEYPDKIITTITYGVTNTQQSIQTFKTKLALKKVYINQLVSDSIGTSMAIYRADFNILGNSKLHIYLTVCDSIDNVVSLNDSHSTTKKLTIFPISNFLVNSK